MNRFAIALLAGVAGVSVMSSAFAADLIINEPAPAVGVVQASGNWDGLFIGAFGGFASGNVDDTTVDLYDIEGWLVGAAIGANFTVTDGVVAGIVADLAWSDVNTETDLATELAVDWVGSVRGRLGIDGGAFLPYLTAGLAVAGADVNGETNTHIGWTAGAGVEFAATEDLSIDLQYRYSDYGAQTYLTGDHAFQTHQVTVGLNWKF